MYFIRATLAAPLSHPQYQKNSDIGDQMIKKPLQQPHYLLPSFSLWTKTPSPSLYKGNLSSTPISGTHSLYKGEDDMAL
jgi:hypothetical protein